MSDIEQSEGAEPRPQNEERLRHFAEQYERAIGAVPGLRVEIARAAMGSDRYDQAIERSQLGAEVVDSLPDDVRTHFERQMAQHPSELPEQEASEDPEIAELEAIRNRLTMVAHGYLMLNEIHATDPPVMMSATQRYTAGDGTEMMRYAYYPVRNGKIVAEIHNINFGSINAGDEDDRTLTEQEIAEDIDQEEAMGLNRQPLSEKSAEHLAKITGTYHRALVDMAGLDQAVVRNRLDLDS